MVTSSSASYSRLTHPYSSFDVAASRLRTPFAQRPLLTVSALILCILTVSLVLSDHESGLRQKAAAYLPDFPLQRGTTAATPREHGFYSQPGMLQVDRRNSVPFNRRARWLPLSVLDSLVEKGMNGLEPELELNDGWDLLEAITTANDRSVIVADDPEFGYLQNKTVVLIGDSVDRGAINFACDLLNGTLSFRQFNDAPHDLNNVATDWRAEPHRCLLPESLARGTTIWSFMTYGSTAEEETFAKALPKTKPRALPARLQAIAAALGNANIQPDLVLLHTLLWDLNTANLIDAIENAPPSEVLDIPFVTVFRDELHEALAALNELFPAAKKIYRLLHSVRVDKGDWFMQHTPAGTKHIQRTPYAVNKGQQLNAVVEATLPKFGVVPFDLRSVLSGYLEDFQDAIHPGAVGRSLYTQMLL